jgi:hypothetical protein
MLKKSVLAALLFAAGTCAAISSAQAGTVIPYPNSPPPTENPERYTFTATTDGQIVAYFAGSGAGLTEVVGMLVNGVPTGITGLNDHTSNIGDSIVLGNVHAGDTLIFFDHIVPDGDIWFSDVAMNRDGTQHVYSAPYDGQHPAFGNRIPAGIYVGFEDLPRTGGAIPIDFNYFDDTFVFTNVTATNTPLPAALPLFATGLGGFGLLGWRKARKRSAA